MGFEVTPEVFTVGSAVGHLREKGYLMTEIDVKLLSQKVAKERAVFGNKPIGEILIEQEEAARLFKSQSWKVLSTLYNSSPAIKMKVDGLLGSISDSFDSFSAIAEDYYRMRGDHNAQFSSFFYTDTIRVFKTRDIYQYFGKSTNNLQQDFAETSFFPKVRPIPEENRFEEKTRAEIESWLDSGDIHNLLRGPLPTGIGNDDARILKDIAEAPVNHKITGHVTVILSDDSGLIRSASATLKQKDWGTTTTACVCQLRRNDYTAICLQGVREEYDISLSRLTVPPRLHRVEYYNYILRRTWSLPSEVVVAIRDMIPGGWRKTVECRLYYDVPNIERGLERTTYRSDTNTVTVWGTGCLDRLTIDTLPYGRSWAENPISKIKEWDDFSSTRRRTLHARRIRVRAAGYVARPERIVSTRAIEYWLNH
jgi:hypothetical protein